MTDDSPRICDYEGSTYRTDFWEGGARNYEDLVERQVIRRLLPARGKRLLEIGAGFGRLSEEYRGYEQVILLDYSFSQLQYAREQLGDEGYLYVAADAYHLPFLPGVFDAATMIRVIHHFEDVAKILPAIRTVLAPSALFLLEFANKRHVKSVLRYRSGQQDWHPDALNPIEFVELNFNFHPAYISEHLQEADFITQARVPVSFLRIGLLKRLLPAGLLASLDRPLQSTGWLYSPSIFTLNQAGDTGQQQLALAGDAIFASPITGEALTRDGHKMVAPDGTCWEIRDGIYDFKQPMTDG